MQPVFPSGFMEVARAHEVLKPDVLPLSVQLGFMSRLSGEVPQSLGKMQQLGYLDIAGNMLTGSLPTVTSGNMINLRLAENFLTGTISPAYGMRTFRPL